MEKLWRKKKLTVYHDMYVAEKQKLQNMIKAAKTQHYKGKIREFSGDQGQLFLLIAHLQNTKGNPILPEHNDKLELCTKFNNFFITKISGIRSKLDNSTLLTHGSGSHAGNLYTASPTIFTKQKITNWKPVSEEQVAKLIKNASNASCKNDPLPTKILKDYLQEQLIPIICHIVNCSLKNGVFPKHYKIALVKPLLKKKTVDSNVLRNYRPVSNLTYVSKLLEKVVAEQLTEHPQKHDLLESFQSAYKPNHSTETALLKVSNGILQALDNK